MGWLRRLHRIPGGNILIVFIAIQIVCVACGLAFPAQFRYLASANISVMLEAIPTLGFISLGVGVLMISGEYDLSVGSVYTFTSIVAATLLNDYSVSAWIGAPVAVLIGAAIGVVNGLITVGFAMPSFIVTLGAMLFWRGMILLLHGALSIGFEPDAAFQNVFGGSIGLLPMSFIWLALFCVGFHVMLQHRRLGNHMFAVGGNRDAATAIGIRPAQVKLIGFRHRRGHGRAVRRVQRHAGQQHHAGRRRRPRAAGDRRLRDRRACRWPEDAAASWDFSRRRAHLHHSGRAAADARSGLLSRYFRGRADRRRGDPQPARVGKARA